MRTRAHAQSSVSVRTIASVRMFCFCCCQWWRLLSSRRCETWLCVVRVSSSSSPPPSSSSSPSPPPPRDIVAGVAFENKKRVRRWTGVVSGEKHTSTTLPIAVRRCPRWPATWAWNSWYPSWTSSKMRSPSWACICSWTCHRSRWSVARAPVKVPCWRTLWEGKAKRDVCRWFGFANTRDGRSLAFGSCPYPSATMLFLFRFMQQANVFSVTRYSWIINLKNTNKLPMPEFRCLSTVCPIGICSIADPKSVRYTCTMFSIVSPYRLISSDVKLCDYVQYQFHVYLCIYHRVMYWLGY